jgi:hypothetical protein
VVAKALSKKELTRLLTHAGLVLVAFELIKSLIVEPIRTFYSNTTFGAGMPFTTYEADVLSRHRNEFEACLLYLRDFMQAIDADDVDAIQALRTHRNDVAHNLARRLPAWNVDNYVPLLERADRALFKLSNYQTYIEIGSDPRFQGKGIDWNSVKGHEYLLFEQVLNKIKHDRGKRELGPAQPRT